MKKEVVNRYYTLVTWEHSSYAESQTLSSQFPKAKRRALSQSRMIPVTG